jgi:hypothetical protein
MLSVIMLIVRGPFSAVSYTQCMQTHRAECDRKINWVIMAAESPPPYDLLSFELFSIMRFHLWLVYPIFL